VHLVASVSRVFIQKKQHKPQTLAAQMYTTSLRFRKWRHHMLDSLQRTDIPVFVKGHVTIAARNSRSWCYYGESISFPPLFPCPGHGGTCCLPPSPVHILTFLILCSTFLRQVPWCWPQST